MGPDARGDFGVAQAVVSFAAAVGACGQAEVYLADRREGSGNYRAAARVALLGAVVTSLLAVAVMLALRLDFALSLAAAVLVPVITQSQLWRSAAVSLGRIALPAYSSAMAAALRVLALSALWWAAVLNATSAMAAVQMTTALAGAIVLGRMVRRPGSVVSVPSSRGQYQVLLRRGAPLLLFSVLTSITLRSDILAVQMFASSEQVGVYAAASSLSISVLAISGAFKSRVQAALFGDDARAGLRLEMRIIAFLVVPAGVLASVGSPWIVQILFGPGYGDAVSVLRILSFAAVALVFLDVAHAAVVVLGLRRQLIGVAAVGAGVSVVALVALVPAFGADGAALASLLGYSAGAVTGWLCVRKALADDR
nr:polysaccharide biosynthesis C-terminal domain-containing protein [Nakamurella flavida]